MTPGDNPDDEYGGEEHKKQASDWFQQFRDDLCTTLESVEDDVTGPNRTSSGPPGRFEQSAWQRDDEGGGAANAGGGVISVMRGRVFEKAGVNVSTVWGEFSDEFRGKFPGTGEDARFWASGVSVVIHPASPLVPAAHMNTRMIVTTEGWFGGGGDLTPVFPVDEDTRDFHAAYKTACDTADGAYYEKFKKWCDEYFFLPHRKEARGVGGVFFDDLSVGGFARCHELWRSIADSYLPAYQPILDRRKSTPHGEREREFQLYRRGRYVEFNLLYDRGTRFGLQAAARSESILASMPPLVRWVYDFEAEPGSPEECLIDQFLTPRDWLAPDSAQSR